MANNSSRYLSDFVDRRAYEKRLVDVLKPFIRELLFVDAGLLLSYTLAEDSSNLEDILASCAETINVPAEIRYGGSATATCDWGKAPVITVEIELHHPQLTIFFRVAFAPKSLEIEVHGVMFTEPTADSDDAWRRYSAALTPGPLPGEGTRGSNGTTLLAPAGRRMM